MAIDIFVNFCPLTEGLMEKDLILCCDSKVNLNYKIRGEGILIDLKLISVDSIMLEGVSEKLECFYFDNTFPNSVSTKKVIFENFSSVYVKYHWSIYENSDKLLNLRDNDSIFSIEPFEGTFKPQESIEFTLKFLPKNSKIYDFKIDLIVEDIPFQSIKNLHNNFVSNDKSHISNVAKGEPFLISLNSPYPSYPVFSYFLKGSGRPCQITIDPILIDFGDVYLNQKLKKSFTMSNQNRGYTAFKLKKLYQYLFIEKQFKVNNYFKSLKVFNDLKDSPNYSREEVDQIKLFTNYIQKEKVEINDMPKHVEKTAKNNKGISNLNTSNSNSKKSKTPLITNHHEETRLPEYEVTYQHEFVSNEGKLVDFIIHLNATKKGLLKSTVIFEVIEGIPISLDIRANIIGAKVNILSPGLDYGLMSIQEIKSVNFKISNPSPVPINILIKEAQFKNINFKNFKDNNYLEEVEGSLSGPISKLKVKTIMDFNNYDNEMFNLSNDFKYNLKFSTAFYTLQTSQEIDITVYFASPTKIIFNSQLEVMVEDSVSSFLNIYANVQEAFAYLSYLYIKPNSIFLNMPVLYENNIVEIRNPSNLPVQFEWENIHVQDEFLVEFTPQSGVVIPKSSLKITYKIIYYKSGSVDNLFICNIKEMDIPLGLVIQGRVTGLDIKYELTDDTLSYMIGKYDSTSMSSGFSSMMSVDKSKLRSKLSMKSSFDKSLNIFDFKHLKVNKHQTASFIIRNNSGIQTSFNLFVEHYKAGYERNLKSEMMQKTITKTLKTDEADRSEGGERSILSRASNLNKVSFKKNSKLRVSHNLLNDAHEAYNFTSAKGAEFTKLKQIEKDSVLYLSNKKGVAIVVSPSQGFLDKNSEVLITVSIYNECVGDFEDEIISQIKGLPEVRFPINIKIRGNPLQLSPFQPGIDYHAVPPILKMGNVLTKSNMLEKIFKLLNTGSNSISVCK